MGLRARVVAALAVLTVAGCGSSGHPPSALDPARVVPGNAIAYLELTVRPQGALHNDLEGALTRLLGHSPDADIQRAADNAFRKSGLHYKQDIEPWLGQRVGFVATSLSVPGLAFVAPTNDPAAAVRALERGERNQRPFVRSRYRGLAYTVATGTRHPIAFGAVGHYAVIGGTTAFHQIVDTYKGGAALQTTSLSGGLAQAYVNAPRAVAAVMALPTISPQVRQQLRSVLGRAHLPTSLNLSVSVTSHTFTADVRSSGAPAGSASRSGADVSGLPGDSWLAISTGSSFAKYFATGFNAGFIQSFSRAARASGVNPGTLLQQFRQRTGIDLIRDLLPALGPFQLSVQGRTITSLVAGLALYPSNPFAGARLFADIHRLVAKDHSLRVINGSRSFRFGPASLPFPIVGVADLGQRIIARFALSNTHPATGKLSANPTFTRAHAQLPAGSTVPLFVDFGPLAGLLAQTPQFQAGGRDHNALAVLRRLDYFVVGVNSAEHDVRIALGVR
jgi:hypothetical protein